MNSLHAFKTLFCLIRDSKGYGLRLHAGQHIKEIDKTLAVLIIPSAIDTIRAFWCFIVLQFDEK